MGGGRASPPPEADALDLDDANWPNPRLPAGHEAGLPLTDEGLVDRVGRLNYSVDQWRRPTRPRRHRTRTRAVQPRQSRPGADLAPYAAEHDAWSSPHAVAQGLLHVDRPGRRSHLSPQDAARLADGRLRVARRRPRRDRRRHDASHPGRARLGAGAPNTILSRATHHRTAGVERRGRGPCGPVTRSNGSPPKPGRSPRSKALGDEPMTHVADRRFLTAANGRPAGRVALRTPGYRGPHVRGWPPPGLWTSVVATSSTCLIPDVDALLVVRTLGDVVLLACRRACCSGLPGARRRNRWLSAAVLLALAQLVNRPRARSRAGLEWKAGVRRGVQTAARGHVLTRSRSGSCPRGGPGTLGTGVRRRSAARRSARRPRGSGRCPGARRLVQVVRSNGLGAQEGRPGIASVATRPRSYVVSSSSGRGSWPGSRPGSVPCRAWARGAAVGGRGPSTARPRVFRGWTGALGAMYCRLAR